MPLHVGTFFFFFFKPALSDSFMEIVGLYTVMMNVFKQILPLLRFLKQTRKIYLQKSE